jgi:hypothetical protein
MRFSQTEDGRRVATRTEPKQVDMPESDDAGFCKTIGAFIDSINWDEQQAFMALFSTRLVTGKRAKSDLLENVFEFAQRAREMRREITRLHASGRTALDIGESEFQMRPVSFHFENGMPGYMGASIDDDSRITHLSFFVQERVCPNGKQCRVARPIEEVLKSR